MSNVIEMTSTEFRRKLYRVFELVNEGKVIAVTFGKNRKLIGYFVGPKQYKNFNS